MAIKGKPLTIEHRRKISKSLKGKPNGRRGTHLSEESRTKISKAQKGSKKPPCPEERKRRISETLKKIGHCPPSAKGRKPSEETKQKMSKTAKINGNLVGINNPNWQGGKSFESYGLGWTDDLKESIRKRDNYICQECGIHQEEIDRSLDVHHIDYDKHNLNPENLIALCRKCHVKTNINREYWIKYFLTMVA